ncbi:MAG TPA: STAS domain-containing protein [Anaerolineales bacterium]|nr:STAS domain-containing protein [Anaerolineales bacterium]HNB37591.1 STAS domain-containing protein [Anaerolineales bacterium]
MDKLSLQSQVRAILNDEKENAFIVTASGRIDSETAPAFDAELVRAIEINSNLVIDLKGVDYMSSAGLRAVTKASQSAQKAGGIVKLASVPQEIMSVMYTVGLDQKISCFATVDEAMSSF